MRFDKEFDYIVVGCGPWGFAITLELYKKNKNIVCIEKSVPFSALSKATKGMRIHSPIETSHIDERNSLFSNPKKYKPLSIELTDSYTEIINKDCLPIVPNTELINVKYVNKKFLIKTNNPDCPNLTSTKLIYATGTFDSPRKLSINIRSKNVSRYLTNPENHKNENIICIGGGFSSFENAVILSQNNKVKILYRGTVEAHDHLNKGKSFDEKYSKFLSSYIKNYENYNLSNIEFINYINIESIIDNQLCYDGNSIKFDNLFLCIGYDRFSMIPKDLLFLKNRKIFEVGEIIGENIMDMHIQIDRFNSRRLEYIVDCIEKNKRFVSLGEKNLKETIIYKYHIYKPLILNKLPTRIVSLLISLKGILTLRSRI